MSQMKSQQSNKTKDGEMYKYDLPQECQLSILKKCKIEKLEDKFTLLAHPYP